MTLSDYFDYKGDGYGGVVSISKPYVINKGPDFEEHGVTIRFKDNKEKRVKESSPSFLALFEKHDLFNPKTHRNYLISGAVGIITANGHDKYGTARGWTKIAEYEKDVKNFDKKKVELETVERDGKLFTAPSKDFVKYLKQQDMAYSKTVASLMYREGKLKDSVAYFKNHLKNSGASSASIKSMKKQLREREADLSKTTNMKNIYNARFKTFISDLSNSFMELNKPFAFVYEETGKKYASSAQISDFDPHVVDQFLNSMFGDITKDGLFPVGSTGKDKGSSSLGGSGSVGDSDIGLVPSMNENSYMGKIPSTCCLQYSCNPKKYRKRYSLY